MLVRIHHLTLQLSSKVPYLSPVEAQTHGQGLPWITLCCPLHPHVFYSLLFTFNLHYIKHNLAVISWHVVLFLTSICIIWIIWEKVASLPLLCTPTISLSKWLIHNFPFGHSTIITSFTLVSSWKRCPSLNSHWVYCILGFTMFILLICSLS